MQKILKILTNSKYGKELKRPRNFGYLLLNIKLHSIPSPLSLNTQVEVVTHFKLLGVIISSDICA
jgi:hypothetical protein